MIRDLPEGSVFLGPFNWIQIWTAETFQLSLGTRIGQFRVEADSARSQRQKAAAEKGVAGCMWPPTLNRLSRLFVLQQAPRRFDISESFDNSEGFDIFEEKLNHREVLLRKKS